MDRIDLHVEVTPVNYEELANDMPTEGSEEIRNRVVEARKVQNRRFKTEAEALEAPGLKSSASNVHSNSEMSSKQIRKHCQLDVQSAELLKKAMNNLGFSARAYDRILKVSRTIADLDSSENIESRHIAEAIQYRSLDRENWAG